VIYREEREQKILAIDVAILTIMEMGDLQKTRQTLSSVFWFVAILTIMEMGDLRTCSSTVGTVVCSVAILTIMEMGDLLSL